MPDDLARARVLFPDAPVIAVNGAAGEVKAFALFSYHPERFVEFRWIDKQRERFGPKFKVHSVHRRPMPYVDYWWSGCGGSGGSAWGARKMVGSMGFDLVVLCGCPLVPGPYVNGGNLGGFMHRQDVADDMLRGIEREREWHAGCISMSGRTAELLGTSENGSE